MKKIKTPIITCLISFVNTYIHINFQLKRSEKERNAVLATFSI